MSVNTTENSNFRPNMASGSNPSNGFDHSRKPSNVSVSTPPISMPNGNWHNRTASYKFGTHNPDGSPATHYNQLPQHPGAGLPVRPMTPLMAQSPIPQPATSGGRPPSNLPTPASGVPPFGSMPGDLDNIRSMTPSGNHHVRRDSVASVASEISSSSYAQGRNFPHQGRYRGSGYSHGYQGHGQRPSGGRGHPNQYPYNQRGNRSPAPQMMMQGQQMMPTQYGYMQPMYGTDPYQQQMWAWQMAHGVPPQPGPPHAQHRSTSSGYAMMGAYPGPSAMQISRTPSQMSEQRPNSSLARSTSATSHPTATQPSGAQTAQKPQYTIPPKKSKGLAIVDPNTGKEIAKPTKPLTAISPAPAPTPESKSSPQKPDSSTPEPASVRTRTESNVKSALEKMEAMKAAVQRKRLEDSGDLGEKPSSEETSGTSSAVEGTKATSTPVDTEQAEAETSKKIETVEPKALSEPPQEETEEERMDREIREMEEADRLEEERQRKYEKEKAEKLARQKAEFAKSEKGLAEAKAMKDAEAEAEKVEEARVANAEKAQMEAHAAAQQLAEDKRAEDDSREKSLEGSGVNTPAESELSHSQTAALVSDINNLISSHGTGVSTPGSEDSSGMPKSALKKPGQLSRINTGAPPSPTPQQRAIKAARLITSFSDVKYPGDIKAPREEDGSGTVAAGYRYDVEFLLQFRSVVTSKPSPDWDRELKQAMGDGEPSRTPTGNRGHGMSSRQPSRHGNNMFATGAMGSFGQQPTQLPPGTTSAERFAMTNRGPGRPAIGTPNVSFGAMPRGGGSGQISRNASTSSFGMGSGLGIAPPSPRRVHASGRADSSKNTSRGGRKHDDKDAKAMPLTAGQEFKPLAPSSTGWKPLSVGRASQLSGPAPGENGMMDPLTVQRKVKSALNKMTPQNFEKISGQILDIASQSKFEEDGRTLRQVIELLFDKATDEQHWAKTYAEFAHVMMTKLDPEISDPKASDAKGGRLFRLYLLHKCQREFAKGWKVNLPPKAEGQTEEAAMLSDEYYVAAAAKRRGLGLIRFIGELYLFGMLNSRIIMTECLKDLLSFDEKPDEEEIESLCNLLKTTGFALDNEKNKDGSYKNRDEVEKYFKRMTEVMNIEDLPSRMRYMLLETIQLRQKGWQGKDTNKGPKTIDEVHAEAEAARIEKEAEKARQNVRPRNTRGGGGFGFPAPPPLDHSRTSVTPNDLKSLTARIRPNPQATASFGPSSMLGRNANKRGPTSLSSLASEGSDSSRAATPTTKAEKEDTPTSNKFSALGGTTSPPNQGSPETTKANPSN